MMTFCDGAQVIYVVEMLHRTLGISALPVLDVPDGVKNTRMSCQSPRCKNESDDKRFKVICQIFIFLFCLCGASTLQSNGTPVH